MVVLLLLALCGGGGGCVRWWWVDMMVVVYGGVLDSCNLHCVVVVYIILFNFTILFIKSSDVYCNLHCIYCTLRWW